MFRAAEIGLSEKFGQLERPLVDFVRRALVKRRFLMVLIVMLLKRMPHKFTPVVQSFLSPLNLISVSLSGVNN